MKLSQSLQSLWSFLHAQHSWGAGPSTAGQSSRETGQSFPKGLIIPLTPSVSPNCSKFSIETEPEVLPFVFFHCVTSTMFKSLPANQGISSRTHIHVHHGPSCQSPCITQGTAWARSAPCLIPSMSVCRWILCWANIPILEFQKTINPKYSSFRIWHFHFMYSKWPIFQLLGLSGRDPFRMRMVHFCPVITSCISETKPCLSPNYHSVAFQVQ